jgi:general secretion pathway protein G
MILQRKKYVVARGGFTLMELLVVVMILVILAGAAIPMYLSYLDTTKIKRVRVDLVTLSKECGNYKAVMEEYPQSLAQLTQPSGSFKPTLKPEHLLDPWGREYHYQYPGQHNAAYDQPDIWSDGPNAGDANGMIGNWQAVNTK